MTDDERLLSHVRPPGWRNPTPRAIYDLVVIGGGTAGLVCAAGAAGLGARVALVERARLGGDCLNTGCVPSKSLLHSARIAADARTAGPAAVGAAGDEAFAAAMRRLRARRADIAPNDSAARLADRGVDVFFGYASFINARAIAVGDGPPLRPPDGEASAAGQAAVLSFKRAVIATGSRPAVPPIDGLDAVPFLTSETVFDLEQRPPRLAVLGGGPIGCEMAQAFARLGTSVTVFEAGHQLLSREDAEAAATVERALQADGVTVATGTTIESVRADAAGIHMAAGPLRWGADALLVATGRVANVEGLGLDTAGVRSSARGISVDARLRTSNSRVFASGDVASEHRFTHAADALSRIVLQNALFFGRRRSDALVIPRCTFTDPEVAHVGVSAVDAVERRLATITVPLSDVDRAVVDERTDGFVRVHHERGRVLGATVVGPAAGELIGTLAVAMRCRASLAELAGVVFPYPTLSMAFRQAGDAYRRTLLTPGRLRVLARFLRLRR